MEYVLAEKSLQAFVKLAWRVLEPTTPLKWNWHLTLLCEYLEDIALGHNKRLIVNVPPRSLKSTIVTVCFPVWYWTKHPSKRFMCTSYAEGLSTKHSMDRRTILRSDWFQKGWGHKFKLSDDNDTKTEFTNNKRGHMTATSMLGTATGKGGNILIVDDPHDTTIAESEAKRKATLEAFDQKFTTRLDDKKEDSIIVVMQRLHLEDLTGHLLKQGGYVHLCLPAMAEEDEVRVFPVSGRVKQRRKGELLHDARESDKEITEMKLRLGSRGFAGQYQQRPTAKEGGLIKRHWIKYYQLSDLPHKWDELIQSWDCSFEDASTSDYVCGGVWGRYQANKYLLPWICHEQLDVVGTIRAIINCTNNYPKAYAKLVEKKANGHAIIQIMSDKVPGIISWPPEGVKMESKEIRLQAHEPDFEAGNIWLPHPDLCPWVLDFVEELVNFPAVPNDDRVDMTTQALDRFRTGVVSFTENMVHSKISTITGSIRGGGDRW